MNPTPHPSNILPKMSMRRSCATAFKMTPTRKNKPAIIIVGLQPNILVVYDAKNVVARPARYRYEVKSCNPIIFQQTHSTFSGSTST